MSMPGLLFELVYQYMNVANCFFYTFTTRFISISNMKNWQRLWNMQINTLNIILNNAQILHAPSLLIKTDILIIVCLDLLVWTAYGAFLKTEDISGMFPL